MELRFTQEQEETRRRSRQFAITEISPIVPWMERHEAFPGDLLRKMGPLGLLGLPIPKQWGGQGLDFIAYTAALNEISKVSAAVGVILSVHTSVGTLPILRYGNDEQRERYVRRLATGEALGAFALTEHGAGSDAASIRTTAVREDGHYVLNGTKLFITNAGAADVYVTFAVTDATRGPGGITAFIVDKESEGFQIGKSEKKMGLHGSNTCELHFDNVKIPVSQRIGGEGEGFSIAMGSLDGGRIGIGAQALGIAQAALELMLGHFPVKRSSAGKRPRKFAPEHAEIARLAAKTEAARLLVYRAAGLRQEGKPCTREASMAKMVASDTAVEAAGAAVRLLGMAGCLEQSPAERLFRDAKVTQIYEGTNEIHRIVISNQLLR
ncbi:acyl-CoA dehydrogenase family protein [Paenibacillus sp. N4]|uniref:acyl-CoA dehydrogenase family protein n=1 Tax=Paenibacillus vietnamensis TaxID=2590547 RepID=UPI001CD0C61F|nr:acyl-CoA dehydrogenase family protein [Paenibacillus vietnamensis]MCA0754297.1 acyl-CoA dehydrogenase family protein [Paenibacillus vietnamensis]